MRYLGFFQLAVGWTMQIPTTNKLDGCNECGVAVSTHNNDDLSALDFSFGEADDAETGYDHPGAEGTGIYTVINPPETVTVSALVDGRFDHVELSPSVARMTEAELAAEIIVLADLARLKGLAGQRTLLLDGAEEMYVSEEAGAAFREKMDGFLTSKEGVGLCTEDQAAAAEAEVFATRYSADD